MTTGPTPVEAAKRVLLVLVEFLRREPGQPVHLDVVQNQFLGDAWTPVDFQTGVAYAAERHWIEVRDRDAILTAQGFTTV
jgi:hypothetical protein